ncbi:MAG: primosomal protein N' [Gammaproteobacteria bacterium]|nr:primosomal protein N' [Gammaproteobacteria bacterium]
MSKLTKTSAQLILRVAIDVPLYRLFDYLVPPEIDEELLQPGIRLEAPFGTGKKIAYLIETSRSSQIAPSKLKPILRILDDQPLLSADDMKLLLWSSQYYHHPLGEVIKTAFPAALRSGKPSALPVQNKYFSLTGSGLATAVESLKKSPRQQQALTYFQQYYPTALSEGQLVQWNKNWRSAVKSLMAKELLMVTDASPPELINTEVENAKPLINTDRLALQLNGEQQAAVATITGNLKKFAVFLLEGITGSGKTEVYMQTIRRVLERGQQVLVLVPEINLTPQLEARFRERFSVSMTLSHSNLTEKQRHGSWLSMQQGASSILLGTRSALFTPMPKPGLIILDEEHDTSFKQQEGFRFSARDVAIMRAKLLNIPVVLGSATPSLESLYNVQQQRYQLIVLKQRAGNAVEPRLLLMDIRNQKLHSGLSEPLIAEIRTVLGQGEQALLFINRRGFAPTLICHHCGWVARCRHCDANLVIHSQAKLLRCHHCGKEQRLLPDCPACNANQLTPLGLGTERVAETIQTLFPSQTVVRLDRDSTQRKGALEGYLAQINSGEANIIIGTQMLAKGHHFPNVTLVAIIDVDSGLFSIDYHATERLAQTIIQVAGRAGRGNKPGRVILQTRQPGHALLNTLINEGYSSFAANALTERKQALLPPYSYHALVRAQAGKNQLALDFLRTVAAMANQCAAKQTQILGPVPAPMEKRAGAFRYQLLLQSAKRSDLQNVLGMLIPQLETINGVKKIHWSVDVDPADLF